MTDEDPLDRRVFWPAFVIGAALIGYGALTLRSRDVALFDFGLWFLGALALHDLVLAPFVFLVGAVVGRLVSGSVRAAVQAGLILAGLLLVVAIPGLFTDGADPRDPSKLPNDYRLSVLLVLGLIAVGTALGVARGLRRSRS
jgi:hypothetical protein